MTGMMFSKRLLPFVLTAILLLALPAAAGAQIMGLLTLERMSALDTWGTGAKAMAMGGAYTSLSDDALGIVFNPAGIARVRDNEMSIGLHQLWQDVDHDYDGIYSGFEGSYTSLGHIAGLFPYETYTTSIMFGFGIFRVGSSNLEYVRNADRPDLGGTVRNTLLQTGGIYHYKFSVAGKLSRNISVGGTLVFWDGSPDFTEDISFSGDDNSSYIFTDIVSADLDGVSFELGLMARLSTFLHVGAVFTSPAWINYQGSGTEYYDGVYADGTPWTTDPYPFYGEEEYTLPMNFRFGSSLQAENLVVSFDLSYSDYRQTKYEGRKLYYEDDPTVDVLKQVWSYRAGGEFTIPWTTLSLRAGYMYVPVPFKGIDEMTYVVDTGDEFWLQTDWDFSEMEEERHFYTAGVGYVFDDALAIDIAVTRGSFERYTDWLTEKRTVTEFIASAAYRF
jgi:long-subunit fatty acid transport protein